MLEIMIAYAISTGKRLTLPVLAAARLKPSLFPGAVGW